MHAIAVALALQLQIPAPTGYVNDFARALTAAESAAIQRVVDEVRQKSGGEIVVVTLADLGGRASIDVARDIGRQWRVGALGQAGDARRNAGVIVLLKPGQRPGDGQSELAIATGSGAEGFVTDALAGRVRDAIGRTAVEAGSYGAGVLAGVQMLAQAYAREFGFQLDGSSRPPEPAERSPSGSPLGMIIFIVLVLVLLAGRGRRGGRGGRGGGSGLGNVLLWSVLSSMARGGGRGGSGGGGGGGFGGGGFGGFGGGGGFSGGGASGRF